MKKYFLLLTILVWAWGATPQGTRAQEPTPEAATGVVTGQIFDQNKSAVVAKSQEVMLHVWDESYQELGMLHAQSQPDGIYRFSAVDLVPGRFYAVMTTFDDVVYSSTTVPAPADSNELKLDVPVYETTSDPSTLQIDQMHVLFDLATDGLDTTEIYIISNSGERTVKDAITLADGKKASLRFPLPAKADFVFFQPDEQDRFIKYSGGFADTAPVQPGEQSDQLSVKYLVPFDQEQTYSFTAPLDIKMMNFLLPKDKGVSVQGTGLAGPQPYTSESGVAYQVYSYGDISAGQTISLTFTGKPAQGSQPRSSNSTLPLALGGGLLGLAMVGVGIWWRVKPEDEPDEGEETDADPAEGTLDDLITQIARLDQAFERGELDEGEYQLERKRLREQARVQLDQRELTQTPGDD